LRSPQNVGAISPAECVARAPRAAVGIDRHRVPWLRHETCRGGSSSYCLVSVRPRAARSLSVASCCGSPRAILRDRRTTSSPIRKLLWRVRSANTISDHVADISRFRRRAGLPAYDAADGSTGTVARAVTADGRFYHGVNTTLSPASIPSRIRDSFAANSGGAR
jgi:hypothetical protein